MDSDKLLYNHDLPTPEPESPLLPRSRKPYRFSTLCATVENPNPSHKDQYGSSSVPIYQTATFKGVHGEYDYTRSGNPTRTHLGECPCSFYRLCWMGDEQIVCLLVISVRAQSSALLHDLHAAAAWQAVGCESMTNRHADHYALQNIISPRYHRPSMPSLSRQEWPRWT